MAGAVTAATGGAVVGALGLASTGVVSGVVAGVSGSIVGSPLLGSLNKSVFGDKYTIKDFGRDMLISGVVGGVFGGVGALWRNFKNPGNPVNIWTGQKKPVIEIEDLIYDAFDCEGCEKIQGKLINTDLNVNYYTLDEPLSVYRSIDFQEWQSIQLNNYKFTLKEGGYESGKLFARSYSDAVYFNQQFGNTIIIEAQVPAGAQIQQVLGTDGLKYILSVPKEYLSSVKFINVFK